MRIYLGVYTMDSRLREAINRFANSVRSVYNITVPITNIDEVVKTIGGKVELSANSYETYDGRIRKSSDCNFIIEVSENQSDVRKNFTVAHELGHLFLHMGYESNAELWDKQEKEYKREGYSEEEYEANEFAACLLMPSEEYRRVLYDFSDGNEVDVSKIAKYFNVSLPAALNRGRFLGYFE